jgi:hypothetical protein
MPGIMPAKYSSKEAIGEIKGLNGNRYEFFTIQEDFTRYVYRRIPFLDIDWHCLFHTDFIFIFIYLSTLKTMYKEL